MCESAPSFHYRGIILWCNLYNVSDNGGNNYASSYYWVSNNVTADPSPVPTNPASRHYSCARYLTISIGLGIVHAHGTYNYPFYIFTLRQNYKITVVQTRHKTACFQDGDITDIITTYHWNCSWTALVLVVRASEVDDDETDVGASTPVMARSARRPACHVQPATGRMRVGADCCYITVMVTI